MAQVSAQEVSKGPTPDRMAALAGHIIGQRKCALSPVSLPLQTNWRTACCIARVVQLKVQMV